MSFYYVCMRECLYRFQMTPVSNILQLQSFLYCEPKTFQYSQTVKWQYITHYYKLKESLFTISQLCFSLSNPSLWMKNFSKNLYFIATFLCQKVEQKHGHIGQNTDFLKIITFTLKRLNMFGWLAGVNFPVFTFTIYWTTTCLETHVRSW